MTDTPAPGPPTGTPARDPQRDEPRRDDPDAPGNYVAGEGADAEDPPEPNEPG